MPQVGETKTNNITGQRAVFDGQNWRALNNSGENAPLVAQGQRLRATPSDSQTLQREMEAANTARRMRAQLDQFRQLNDKVGTGWGSVVAKPFNSDLQTMEAIQNQMTPNQRPAGSGATSDFEQRMYAKGIPNITHLGTTNDNIYRQRVRDIDGQIARADFYQSFARANGGSTVGAEDMWGQFLATNPRNYNDWRQHFGVGQQPAARPQAPAQPRQQAPTQGRRAPSIVGIRQVN
jgi:hypothetical protein